jgi:riboflavin synthase
MFTGLIADLGRVAGIEVTDAGARLEIETALAAELADGDSIAVNGVCLTVSGHGADRFSADVMNQTLAVTSLAAVEAGGRVNLEPALRAGDRLGGHIVQGHVDGLGRVAAVTADGFARRVEVELPAELHRLVVEHGSICLDGVSLTVAALTDRGAEVSLIPETLERTTLGEAEPGRPLNVEVDVIARYVERLLQGFAERSNDRDD